MVTDTPSPVGRPRTVSEAQRANLYLSKEGVIAGRELVAKRYDMSLSELVDRLLKHEFSLKRGLLRHKRR